MTTNIFPLRLGSSLAFEMRKKQIGGMEILRRSSAFIADYLPFTVTFLCFILLWCSIFRYSTLPPPLLPWISWVFPLTRDWVFKLWSGTDMMLQWISSQSEGSKHSIWWSRWVDANINYLRKLSASFFKQLWVVWRLIIGFSFGPFVSSLC
jgi:hypothetical protein